MGKVYAFLDRTMMTLPKQYSEMRGVLVDAAIFSAFLIRLQANRRLCSASLSFQVCTVERPCAHVSSEKHTWGSWP